MKHLKQKEGKFAYKLGDPKVKLYDFVKRKIRLVAKNKQT